MSVYLSECLKVTLNTWVHPKQASDEAIRVSSGCDNAAYSFLQLTHVQECTLTVTGIFRLAILRSIAIVVNLKRKTMWKSLGLTTT